MATRLRRGCGRVGLGGIGPGRSAPLARSPWPRPSVAHHRSSGPTPSARSASTTTTSGRAATRSAWPGPWSWTTSPARRPGCWPPPPSAALEHLAARRGSGDLRRQPRQPHRHPAAADHACRSSSATARWWRRPPTTSSTAPGSPCCGRSRWPPSPSSAARSTAGRPTPAAELLEDGWNLVIFPEGGRSPDGWTQPFRGGAAYLARRTGRPVVPVYLHGTRHVLPKGGKGIRRTRTTVTFGTPLWPRRGRGRPPLRGPHRGGRGHPGQRGRHRLVDGPQAGGGRDHPAAAGPRCRRLAAVVGPRPPRAGATTGPTAEAERLAPGRPDGRPTDGRRARRCRSRRGRAGPGTWRVTGRPPGQAHRVGSPAATRPLVRGARLLLGVVQAARARAGSGRRRQGPPEQQIGQRGVAGQHRPVEVGAEHPARPCPLGAVPGAVAHPAHHPGQGAAPAPSVVTPPWFSKPVSGGSAARGSSGRRRSTEATSSPTARGSVPLRVVTSSSPRPVVGPVGGVGEGAPEQLVAGAHRRAPPRRARRHGARCRRRCSASAARTWGPSSPPPRQ